MAVPGWPAVLTEGPVMLRPYRRSDAAAWSDSRIANERWLAPWEPVAPGPWREMNSTWAFRAVYRDLNRAARAAAAMPFAVCYDDRLVGQVTLGNIVRRAFCS